MQIRLGETGRLLKPQFLDDTVMVLKQDSVDDFEIYVNETRYGNEINCIEHVALLLKKKYLGGSDNYLQGVHYKYSIIKEKKYYDLFWGNIVKYEIKYTVIGESTIENIYTREFYQNSLGKYFFVDVFGKKYFETFDECVSTLFTRAHTRT